MKHKASIGLYFIVALSILLAAGSTIVGAAPPPAPDAGDTPAPQAHNILAAPVTFVYNSTDVPKDITDLTYVYSTIDVPEGLEVADVNVTLTAYHTWDADLDIYLISPDGTEVELSTDNGSLGDNYIDTTFDDEASTPITSGSAPPPSARFPAAPPRW